MRIETDDYIDIINDKDPTRRIRINKKITFTKEELSLSPKDLCHKLAGLPYNKDSGPLAFKDDGFDICKILEENSLKDPNIKSQPIKWYKEYSLRGGYHMRKITAPANENAFTFLAHVLAAVQNPSNIRVKGELNITIADPGGKEDGDNISIVGTPGTEFGVTSNDEVYEVVFE